jgi:hypothetical protein
MVMAGVVRHITVNDINVGRNVDEILRLIKAHQFVEVSELVQQKLLSVCPVLHIHVSMHDNCVTPNLLVLRKQNKLIYFLFFDMETQKKIK